MVDAKLAGVDENLAHVEDSGSGPHEVRQAASNVKSVPIEANDSPWAVEEDSMLLQRRKRLTDEEILHCFDEFLYHGELRDFLKAQHSFERISSSLGTDDFDALIPPCLEVLEFSNQFIRNDTLLCLMYISLGCTICDAPSEEVVSTMRQHAAVLAKHDSLPMFIRSLDFLLGYDAERMPEEGMLEREFRLIFNCIYIQLLFNEHDEDFIHSLELGQGRLGSSLVSLLFEATKMSADNDKIPIKKVILLLLRVLQCLLQVPDHVLYPMPSPAASDDADSVNLASTVANGKGPMKRPRLREFQAFTALILHERAMRQKYTSSGFPSAIQEGLKIIRAYLDEFIAAYSFHPSEVSFMQNTPFLHDAYERYNEFRSKGLTAPERAGASRTPRLPELQHGTPHAEQWATRALHTALGTLAGTADQKPSSAVAPSSNMSTSNSSGFPSDAGSQANSDASSETASDAGAASDGGASASSTATVVNLRGGKDGMRPVDSRDTAVVPGFCTAGDESDTQAEEGIRDHSPTAVFERLYLAIFPRLTETVVLLLRLLLTSCSNVENYPGVIDMARERHATSILDDVGQLERSLLAPCEKAMPDEAIEAQRHREIMAAAVSGVILILLKQARRSVAEQFSSLAQLITDSNGALVVLKFLNQDLSAAMDPRDTHPVLPCLRGQRSPEKNWMPSWPACATLRLVEVLYLLCKDSPERVRKYLIHYKAPFILKRLHRIDNQQVQSLVLKLLKKQVRYLPRKWKQANMKAISAIYSLVPMSPLEDWLLNEALGEPSTEGPSQADIRASNVVYNAALLRHLSGGPWRTASGSAQSLAPESSLEGVGDLQSASASSPPTSFTTRTQAGSHTSSGAGLSLSQVAAAAFNTGNGSGVNFGIAAREETEVDAAYGEVINGSFGYAHMFPEFAPVPAT